MKQNKFLISLCIAIITIPSSAQNGDFFAKYKTKVQEQFNNYKKQQKKAFENYRRECNEKYALYLKEAWKTFKSSPIIPLPKEQPIPPVIIHEEKDLKLQPISKPLPFDEIITIPKPKPQPTPPIEEIHSPQPNSKKKLQQETVQKQNFLFYGTPAEVRIDKNKLFQLESVNEETLSKAWKELSTEKYNNLIYDCLEIRKKQKLCDWAYLMMLKEMADAVCGKGTNESTFLLAYVYCQSGYKMRLGINSGKLVMLYASLHDIYNKIYYSINNEKYYPFNYTETKLRICDQKYPQEQSMSLSIPQEQLFTMNATKPVEHKSTRYPEMDISIIANQNLLDFYSSYPTSTIDNNFLTRWAMYADMPLSESLKEQIYPTIKNAITNCNQITAINKILNWIQTGFKYEYDDKVWGYDRAFFPEESLYYPYCDCEDRSIMFTRIIRDILHLKCLLVYYPGHLATAVEITEGKPTGDYISYNNRNYFIADGTITGVGAPVGITMSGMDNKTAKVIVLDN